MINEVPEIAFAVKNLSVRPSGLDMQDRTERVNKLQQNEYVACSDKGRPDVLLGDPNLTLLTAS